MKQDLIWNYFQNDARESFSGSRARLLFLAQQTRNQKVLNIGAGGGIFEREALTAGADVYSLDPNEGAIERIRLELGLGEKAKVGKIQRIDFPDEVFDVVVVSEVLEHLDNETLTRGLGEIRRILRPGGRVLGTVPFKEK